MKHKYFKIITSILISIVFLVFAFGSGSDNTKKISIDINDTNAIQKYLQGKWEWERHTGSVNFTERFRFEIVGNKLKIWSCIGNTDDPFKMDMEDDPKIHEFTLGEPTRDVDGYHCRYLEFDEGNVSLAYRSLSPIWIVSDDNWNEPVIRCASGIPSWSRAEFQSTESKNTETVLNEINDTNSNNDYSQSEEEQSSLPTSHMTQTSDEYFEVLELMENYYEDFNSSNFDANKWFIENIIQYITIKNTTPNEVNELQQKNNEYINGNFIVNPESFKLVQSDKNTSEWQFEGKFSCYRTSKKKYQSCKILVEVGINKYVNKMYSYKEVKVSDLIFTQNKQH